MTTFAPDDLDRLILQRRPSPAPQLGGDDLDALIMQRRPSSPPPPQTDSGPNRVTIDSPDWQDSPSSESDPNRQLITPMRPVRVPGAISNGPRMEVDASGRAYDPAHVLPTDIEFQTRTRQDEARYAASMAQQPGVYGRFAANVAGGVDEAVRQAGAGWSGVAQRGLGSVLDEAVLGGAPAASPEDFTGIMSDSTREANAIRGEAAGATSRFVAGLASMPATFLDPKTIAAMLISHSPSAATSKALFNPMAMAAIEKKFGTATMHAVQQMTSNAITGGGFGGAHAAVTGGDVIEGVTQGAAASIPFGVAGTLGVMAGERAGAARMRTAESNRQYREDTGRAFDPSTGRVAVDGRGPGGGEAPSVQHPVDAPVGEPRQYPADWVPPETPAEVVPPVVQVDNARGREAGDLTRGPDLPQSGIVDPVEVSGRVQEPPPIDPSVPPIEESLARIKQEHDEWRAKEVAAGRNPDAGKPPDPVPESPKPARPPQQMTNPAVEERQIVDEYLAKYDHTKGQVPARQPYLPGRDEALAEAINSGDGPSGSNSTLYRNSEHAQDAIDIGERLGYRPEDIAAYLHRNYTDEGIGLRDSGRTRLAPPPEAGPKNMAGQVREAPKVKPPAPDLPQASIDKMDAAIKAKDMDWLINQGALDPKNRKWREQFTSRTGVKLPTTQMGTRAAVVDWIKKEAAATEKPAAPAPGPSTPEKPAPKADPKANRFRVLAHGLKKQADELSRDMTQNPTPKRMREYGQRRTESHVLYRAQKAFEAMADAREAGTLPPELESVSTKAEVVKLLSQEKKINGGYYDAYYETGEYLDKSPKARALQDLIAPKSEQQKAAAAAKANEQGITDLENKVRFSDIPGFFPTPKALVERMIVEADIGKGMKVLEPSAGKGDIADAAKAAGASVTTAEISHPLREILKAKGHDVVAEDFLQHKGKYDRIVMNPPFERGQDIEHVQHAYEQLTPGGKLVAIMSEGSFTRSDKKATGFREWLDSVGGTSEKVPAGAFAEQGAFKKTGVSTRLVTIERPVEGVRPAAAAEAPAPEPASALSQLDIKPPEIDRKHIDRLNLERDQAKASEDRIRHKLEAIGQDITAREQVKIQEAVKAVEKGPGWIKKKDQVRRSTEHALHRADPAWQKQEDFYNEAVKKRYAIEEQIAKAETAHKEAEGKAAEDTESTYRKALSASSIEELQAEKDRISKADDAKHEARLKETYAARSRTYGNAMITREIDPRIKIIQDALDSRYAAQRARLDEPVEVTRRTKSGEMGAPKPEDISKPGTAATPKNVDYTKKVDASKLGADEARLMQQAAERPVAYLASTPDDPMFGSGRLKNQSANGIAKLKEFVREVPEFALDPAFFVFEHENGVDFGLRFKDGGTYKFTSPEAVGIHIPDYAALKAGQRIGVDLAALKTHKPTDGFLVASAAPEGTHVGTLGVIGSKIEGPKPGSKRAIDTAAREAKFEKGTVRVGVTKDNPEGVEKPAEVYKGLAVVRPLDGTGYLVLHEKSGLRIFHESNRENAKRLAVRAAELTDWSVPADKLKENSLLGRQIDALDRDAYADLTDITAPKSDGGKAPSGGMASPARDLPALPIKGTRIQPDPITGRKTKQVSEMMLDLEKGIGQVRSGSSARNSIGTYYPGSSKTTVRFTGDLDTAAHEVAHRLDDLYGIVAEWATPKGFNKLGRKIPKKSPFDKELRADIFQQTIRDDYSTVEKRAEGVAEYIRAWMLNPAEATKQAPGFTKFFEQKVPGYVRERIRAFGDDVRGWAGQDPLGKASSNIKFDFKGPGLIERVKQRFESEGVGGGFLTRLNAAVNDSLAPVWKGIELAKQLQGIDDMLPAADPKMRLRLFNGFDRKAMDVLAHGPIRFNGERAPGVGGVDWIIKPLKSDTKAALEADTKALYGYMTSQRVVERVQRIRDALQEARQLQRDIEQYRAVLAQDPLSSAGEDLRDAIFRQRQVMRGVGYSGSVDRMGEWAHTMSQRMSGAGGGVYSDISVAKEALAEAQKDPARLARIKEAAQRHRAWSDAVLQYMVDGGRVSAAAAKEIRDGNQFYVAMKRLHETVGSELRGGGPGSKRLASAKQTIQQFKGSTREVENPFVSLIKDTYDMMRETDRNAAMASITRLLDKNRGRDMYQGKPIDFDQIGSRAASGDMDAITIYRDGKAESWQFAAPIHKALQNWGISKTPDLISKAMMSLASLMRNTITLAPQFMIRQQIRDPLARAMVSRSGTQPWEQFYFLTPAGIHEYAKIKSEFDRAGGGLFGHQLVSKEHYYKRMRGALAEAAGDGNTILSVPGKIGNAYKAMAEGGETINRLAEYRRAYAKAKAAGLSDLDARMKAALEARDLQDFSVAGTLTRALNSYIPFTSAAVRGVARAVESAVENPARFAARWALYVASVELAHYAWNHSTGAADEERKLTAYRRDFFWNYRLGDWGWLSIPKPYELGVMGSGLSRLLDKARGVPDAFDGYAGSFWQASSPLSPGDLMGPLQPIVSVMSNYNFDRQKPIVPDWEVKIPPGRRLGERMHSSKVGQLLGKWLGVDARYIDTFIRTQLGGLGTLAIRATEPDNAMDAAENAGAAASGVLYKNPK